MQAPPCASPVQLAHAGCPRLHAPGPVPGSQVLVAAAQQPPLQTEPGPHVAEQACVVGSQASPAGQSDARAHPHCPLDWHTAPRESSAQLVQAPPGGPQLEPEMG